MKNKKTVLPVVIAIGVASVATAPLTFAQSLIDYKDADTSYTDAYIYGDMNLYKNRTDDQSGYDFNLSVDYDKVIGTDARDTTIRGVIDGAVTRGGSAKAERNESYTAGLSATIDTYFRPGSDGAFWYGSGSVEADSQFDHEQIRGVLGLGYGRVYNVTPMAKAIRVVEELMERTQLVSTPDGATYREVAEIIDRESEYLSKHGDKDYAEIWIQDIAQVLQNSGAAAEDFSASSVIEMYEILTRERISTRKRGYKVRAGLGYTYRTFDGDSDSHPTLVLGAEYHRPLSNQTQFSNEAELVTLVDDGDDSFTATNVMSVTHEISDVVDWENAWIFDYTSDGTSGIDVTVNTLSSSLYYSLNNSLDLVTTARLANYSGDTNADNPDGTDRSLLVGIRYRLK